jgi:Na+-transporting NADH:ubiquinone oxidoreductase subunit NqrD
MSNQQPFTTSPSFILTIIGIGSAVAFAAVATNLDVRTFMRSIVSLSVLGVSFFVILQKRYTEKDKRWAYAAVGTVLGYWLNNS